MRLKGNARPLQMALHLCDGPGNVMRRDVINDLGMFREGHVLTAGAVQKADMIFKEPTQHRVGNR